MYPESKSQHLRRLHSLKKAGYMAEKSKEVNLEFVRFVVVARSS